MSPLLYAAASYASSNHTLKVICCENGVNVKKPLIDHKVPCIISEGIIFCTTLQPDKDQLHVLCEEYPELPVDGSIQGMNMNINGMPLVMNFSSLIQRKIYTYNFISAVIAYLGDYEGYEVYGEAANNPIISSVIEEITPLISRIIANNFNIAYEEQLAFTIRAISKFKNKEIHDTIARNSVQAIRKLGEKERIITPLRFAVEQQESTSLFSFICAAACRYGIEKEEMDVEEVYSTLHAVCNDEVTKHVKELTEKFLKGLSLESIIENI